MSYETKYQLYQEYAYLSVNKNIVQEILFYQSVKKVSRPNLHDFSIVCILCDWDADWNIFLAMQSFKISISSEKLVAYQRSIY